VRSPAIAGRLRAPRPRTKEAEVSVATATEIRPFHVDVPEEKIDDLRRRIAATRWPGKELVPDRSQGVQLETAQELAAYWASDYNWRTVRRS